MDAYLPLIFLVLFIISASFLEFHLGVRGETKGAAMAVPALYSILFFILTWLAVGLTKQGILFAGSQVFVGYFFYSFYEAGIIAMEKNSPKSDKVLPDNNFSQVKKNTD